MVHFFFYMRIQANTVQEKIQEFLFPLCTGLGVTFWGMELALSSPKHKVVRIYIDTDQGVTIEQCADVSRHLGVILEVEDIISGAYTLEVSSPGLDRRFFFPGQLSKYIGQQVKLSLHTPREDQKNFQGMVKTSEGEKFSLCFEDETMQEFTWDETSKIRLVYTG